MSSLCPDRLKGLPVRGDGSTGHDSRLGWNTQNSENCQGNGIPYPQTGGFQDTNSSCPGKQDHSGWGLYGPQWSDVFTGGNNPWNTTLPMFDFGQNPIVAAKLQLNGHDRFL